MKRRMSLLSFAAWALAAQAQGTLQFRATLTGAEEVPPNADPTVGTARLTLTGNVLDFYVYVPALTFITTGGSINGPAQPGGSASVIFDLGGFRYHSGSSFGDPPFYSSGSPGVGPVGGGPFTLSDSQMNELMSGLWYVNITSSDHPDGQLRGQIVVSDSDGDGIPDGLDQCPNTAAGAIVDSHGCSIDQLCPCAGPWRSHGEYVACVARTAAQFQRDGIISEIERRNIVNGVIRSNCGKR